MFTARRILNPYYAHGEEVCYTPPKSDLKALTREYDTLIKIDF